MKKLYLLIITLCSFTFNISHSEPLEISITEGEVKKTNIAISEFYTPLNNDKTADIIQKINSVMNNDLMSSGLFQIYDKQSFMQKPNEMRFRPKFADWRPLNVEILVTGKVIPIDNKFKIEMYVWDIIRQKQIFSKRYMIVGNAWRRLSHLMSDDIYTRVTGETGYFDSRVLFVSEQKKENRKLKKIAIMDLDGENIKYITDGKYIALTPRFSPDKKHITYMSYKKGIPAVYLHNIRNGKVKFLGEFKNMTYAPRFSPDGEKLIFSYAISGRSNIWSMDITNSKFKQITNNDHIDTSPAYFPDGKNIVFTSNRDGSPQIYIMNLSSSKVKRLTTGDGSYTTPVVSPRGDLIAFTKQSNGKFYIGVMNIDGTGERLISNSFLDEGPSFAPNGRTLIFFRNDIELGKTKLMSIDITGYNLREIKTPHGASDPNWSGLNTR